MAEGVLLLDAIRQTDPIGQPLVPGFLRPQDRRARPGGDATSCPLAGIVGCIIEAASPAQRLVQAREIELPRRAAALLGWRSMPRPSWTSFRHATRAPSLFSTISPASNNWRATGRNSSRTSGHELRTPISLIKGFVETLLDGAKSDPRLSTRFLRTIEKQYGSPDVSHRGLALTISRTWRAARL